MSDTIKQGKEREPGEFDQKFDFETRRVSFKDGFLNYYNEHLGFIAGVLDMIFHLAETQRLEDLDRSGLSWVILEAHTRAKDLKKNIDY